MLEPLQSIYIHPTKLIKLRFRYKLPNTQLKVLILFLDIKFIQPKQLTVYDFLFSIMEDLLSPFLLVQNHTVSWESVSITYPLKNGSKSDLLKLPLFNVRGLIQNELAANLLKTMNISVRFEGRPLPSNTKLYGVDITEANTDKLISKCSYVYTNQYTIKETGIVYKVAFQGPRKKTKKNSDVIHPIMAFASVY